MKIKLIIKILAMLLMCSFLTATPAQAGIGTIMLKKLIGVVVKQIIKLPSKLDSTYLSVHQHYNIDLEDYVYYYEKSKNIVTIYQKNVTSANDGDSNLYNCYVYTFSDGGSAMAYGHYLDGNAASSEAGSVKNNYLGAISYGSGASSLSYYAQSGTYLKNTLYKNVLESYSLNGNAYGVYNEGYLESGIQDNIFLSTSLGGDAYGLFVSGGYIPSSYSDYFDISSSVGNAYGIYLQDTNSSYNGSTTLTKIENPTIKVESLSSAGDSYAVGVLVENSKVEHIIGTGKSPIFYVGNIKYKMSDWIMSDNNYGDCIYYTVGDSDYSCNTGYFCYISKTFSIYYNDDTVIDISANGGSAIGIGVSGDTSSSYVNLVDNLAINVSATDGNAIAIYTENNHQIGTLSNVDININASGNVYGYMASGKDTVDEDYNTGIAFYNENTGTSTSAVENLDYGSVNMTLTSTGVSNGANSAYGVYVTNHTLGESINFDSISVTAAGTPYGLYLIDAPIEHNMDIDFEVYTYSLTGYGAYINNSAMSSGINIDGSLIVSMPSLYDQTGTLNSYGFYLMDSKGWTIDTDITLDAAATYISVISLDEDSTATFNGTATVDSYSSSSTEYIEDSGNLYVYTLGTNLKSSDSLLFHNRDTDDSTNINMGTNASIDVNDFTAKLIEEAGSSERTKFTYGLVIDGTDYDYQITRTFDISGLDYGVVLTNGADLYLSSAHITGYTAEDGTYTEAKSYVDSTSSLSLHAADNSSAGDIYVSAGGSASKDDGSDVAIYASSLPSLSGEINLTLGSAVASLSSDESVFGNLLGNLYILSEDLDLEDEDGDFDGTALADLDGSSDLSGLANSITINLSLSDYGALLGDSITIHNEALSDYIDLVAGDYIKVTTTKNPLGTSNTITVDDEITIDITDSNGNTGKVYFTENSDLVNADIVASGGSTVVYYELNEGDEQTIDKINLGGDNNQSGYLVLSGGTLNTTNSDGDGMFVNNDTDITTGKLLLESGTINLNGVLSFSGGETTVGSVEIVGGTTKLGILETKLNEGKSSTVKLESDSTLYFNSGDISLREDSAISVATEAVDTTLIIEGANLTSIENENVTPEDYILSISDITTISIDDSTFDLAVVFDNIASLSITDSTINYALTFSDIGELNLSSLTLAEGINIDLTGDVALSGAVEVSSGTAAYSVTKDAIISGEAIAYGTGEVVAIEATDGIANLKNDTVVAALVYDSDDNFVEYGTAITNTGTSTSLTIKSEDAGNIYVYGKIIGNSDITINEGTTTIETGSYISTQYTEEEKKAEADKHGTTLTVDGTLILSMDSDGNMGYIKDTGLVTGSGSIEVDFDAGVSNLIGESHIIYDEITLEQNEGIATSILDEISYDTTNLSLENGVITVSNLTDFQDAYAGDYVNINNLAVALDSISTFDGDTEYQNKVDFKTTAEANGLSSYMMNNYSQIAEVNSMLLSNHNFANVNRTRSILEKSAGVQIEDEDGSISIENEDGTISVVDASEVSLIKYSNVAQLQSINLLGSKDASNGVAGYDYWSVGSTANFDEILSENALIGASIGGTYNKVSGDAGESANSTTFLLNAYATYANEGLEVFANIGYAHFWNEGYNAGSKADWDSDAFNGLIGISYDLETTVAGLTITPLAMLNMVYQNSDSASYSNGVNVEEQSYFSAKLMIGLEFEYAINAQFNAIIRTMYTHECGDETYDFTYGAGFVNGVEYVGSQAGKDAALMGLGLSYDFSETCTAYFDYNAYAYSNLITHSLNLSVALKF